MCFLFKWILISSAWRCLPCSCMLALPLLPFHGMSCIRNLPFSCKPPCYQWYPICTQTFRLRRKFQGSMNTCGFKYFPAIFVRQGFENFRAFASWSSAKIFYIYHKIMWIVKERFSIAALSMHAFIRCLSSCGNNHLKVSSKGFHFNSSEKKFPSLNTVVRALCQQSIILWSVYIRLETFFIIFRLKHWHDSWSSFLSSFQ